MAGRPVVVDASAIAAILFNEPAAPRMESVLEGRPLLAPTLLAYEVANVAVRKIQLYPGQADGIRKSASLLDRLEIDYVQVPATALIESAASSDLTSYDAAYLYLSGELGLPLLTLDRGLNEAARIQGIETFDD
jgi:predicted nucleic acid-binding protein